MKMLIGFDLKWKILYASLLLLAISEFALRSKLHGHFGFEEIPLFYVAMGFVGCIILIIGSKLFGDKVAVKEEDYYDRDRDDWL